jgi:4'-phosphopantetheinyl transferase
MQQKPAKIAAGDFLQTVNCALLRVQFTMLSPGAASVLLFDSALWGLHTESAEGLLDAGEQARAARFRFERDREPYVVAHAVWRAVLGVCLGVDASDVNLGHTPAGQPFVVGTELATSLSHSGSWVAIAVCAAQTVGVDIERSPSRLTLSDVMPSFCTAAEIAEVMPLHPLLRESALLSLWTRKEALLKAFGTGLGEETARMKATTTAPVMPPASATHQVICRVRDIDLPAGLVGALAAPTNITACRLHWLDDMCRR